jgi:tRNA pseudouridine55 synthase
VRINVKEFEAIAPDGTFLTANDDGSHDLRVRVVCSAGTYIRTLAEDFGRRLEVGAHVASLHRTRAGQFRDAGAITLDRLSELTGSVEIESALISPDAAMAHLPAVTLSDGDMSRTLHGVDIQVEAAGGPSWPDGQPVRMRDESGKLIAVGVYDDRRKVLHPKVVIAK